VVTVIPCYVGFTAEQGAEGVGRATTTAVVVSSVMILLLDTVLAKLLLPT
jgi:phospholipid/cholesterol/gamma-HCH transport system permease protein